MPRRTRHPHLHVVQLESREVPAFLGGINVAVGDVNGDGYRDIVVAQASQGDQVEVIDGKTGTVTLSFNAYDPSFTGGVYVAVGDIDGDGRSEIITGTGNGGGPNVKVFDGKTGNVLLSFFPYEGSFRGGVIVAAADVNGDGKAEIITGTGVGGGPRVQIVDAATQTPIADFFAYESTFRGGVLVGAGDVTGDHKAEIITGTGVGGGPRVEVFDAANLTPVENFFAYEDSFRGGVLVGASDLNGDGKAEVLTGTGPGGGPVVTSFDGTSATSGVRFLAFDPSARGGVNVSGADITGDGDAEFACGAGIGDPGIVNVFKPDGTSRLYSFSPFDGQVPGVAIGSPTTANTVLPPPAPAGLTVSQTQALSGVDQQIVFQARQNGAKSAQLFLSDAAGDTGDYLVDLFDDGDFSHRDIAAADGVFSNSITVNFPTAGDHYYLAKVTANGATTPYVVKVTAVDRPSDAVLQQRIDDADSFQTELDNLLDGGSSVSEGLDQIQTELFASAAVQQGSVHRAIDGIYWTTTEGIQEQVSAGGADDELGGSGTSDGSDGSNGIAAPMDSGSTCQGKAVFISPYHFQPVIGDNDPVNILPAFLTAHNFQTPDIHMNTDDANRVVLVNDFKGLGRFNYISIETHGFRQSEDGIAGPVLASGERINLSTIVAHLDDVYAGRLSVLGTKRNTVVFGLNPSFFAYYSGLMKGDVVTLEACNGLFNDRLAQVFGGLGADAIGGFSTTVKAVFATNHAVAMVEHLVTGGTYGSIPGIGDVSNDANQTTFRVFARDPDGKFKPRCDDLADVELVIAYSWPNNEKDMDTGTTFLGVPVGYNYGTSQYMTWSGDNTSTGGVEKVVVDLYGSWLANQWNNTVDITLVADWYTPSGGTGSATVFVGLRNKDTGEVRQAFSKSISPGQESNGATSTVGTATIALSGDPVDPDATLTLS